MSTLTRTPPGLKKSGDFWVDVEVPYNKIMEKWSGKYRPRMRRYMENSRLQRRVLAIYFKTLGRRNVPQDRNEALEFLWEKDKDRVYNLCSQLEFSTGISSSIITKFAQKYKSDIIDYGFEEDYYANMGGEDGNPNKDGLVALCQLSNPSSLKDILVYDRHSSRYPTNIYKRNKKSLPDETDWHSLIKRLSDNQVEDYAVWHQFEIGNERFVAIEQEDRDGVERQVGDNIEEEPANLVILHFNGNYLDVYTDKRGTANNIQIGVNSDVSGEDYGEDRNEVDSDTVGEFAKEVTKKDKERDQTEDDEDYEYVLTDLWVNRTGLPNNPQVKLSSEAGVGRAIEELESKGYDLLSDNRNIERVKMRFEGWKFTIKQIKRKDNTGGTYRELIYGCSADTETRQEFEDLIEEEFGIEVKYKSS